MGLLLLGRGVVLVALLFIAGAVSAQNKIPVYVSATVQDNDHVGRQLIFELKEAIRSSSGFRLVEESKQWPYMKISMVTIRTSEASTAAAYGLVYDSSQMPARGAFISAFVLTCPQAKVITCARGMLSDVDGAVAELQKEDPSLWKTLR